MERGVVRVNPRVWAGDGRPPPLQKIMGENLVKKSDFYKFLG